MTTRLDRVQRACIAAMLAATPAAVAMWAPSSYPTRALGDEIVTAQIVRGPLISGTSRYFSAEPTNLIWRVSSAATAARVGLALTGGRWATDVVGGDTDTTIRDRLIVALTAGATEPAHLPGVTIATDSTDGIRFTADGGAVGLLWGAAKIGPSAVTLAADVEADCEVTTARAACMIEFMSYAVGRGVEAMTLLGALAGALNSADMIAIKESYGVSFNGPMTEPVDLTSIAGADWESRASARLAVNVRSYRAIPIDDIDTATTTTAMVI